MGFGLPQNSTPPLLSTKQREIDSRMADNSPRTDTSTDLEADAKVDNWVIREVLYLLSFFLFFSPLFSCKIMSFQVVQIHLVAHHIGFCHKGICLLIFHSIDHFLDCCVAAR